MLKEVKVKNFAIIEDIEVKFNPNMTVLTGQTGAGKSLIIDAISLLLGARADLDMIRYGESESIISATFNNLTDFSKEAITNLGITFSDELIITRGTDGIVIDIEYTKNAIIDAIKSDNKEKIEVKTKYEKCPEIDILSIYSEVKSEPQNATYNEEMKELIPHKNGIDFDLEKAKQLLKDEKEEYVIELIIIEPDILTNEIGEEAFPDLLSSFSTSWVYLCAFSFG